MQTSEYYDHQAGNQPSRGAWKARRAEHNHVKTLLFQYVQCRRTCYRIADLACGKGGDLHKYQRIFPNARLTCIDVSQTSLQVLKSRASEIGAAIDRVVHGDAAKTSLDNNAYDLVAIHFAIHYFCDTKEHLSELLQNAANGLKHGGVIVGTCIDFRTIKFENDHIRAKPGLLDGIEETPWGRSYRYQLAGCVDTDEWVVHFPSLVALAHSFGLHLVKCQSFNGFLFAHGVNPNTPTDNSPYMVFVFVRAAPNNT